MPGDGRWGVKNPRSEARRSASLQDRILFPGQGSRGAVSLLGTDRVMSARDDEVRIECDRPRGGRVSKTERGSPFGQVVAPNNFGR